MDSISELKYRVNDFITKYHRQQSEKEYEKQKLKQNVMLEIMSNKNKSSQVKSSSSRVQAQGSRVESVSSRLEGSHVAPGSEYRRVEERGKSGDDGFNRSNSFPNAFENPHTVEIGQSAEITFKSKNVPITNNNIHLQGEDFSEEDQYNDHYGKDIQGSQQPSNIKPQINNLLSFSGQNGLKTGSFLEKENEIDKAKQIAEKYSQYKNKYYSDENSNNENNENSEEIHQNIENSHENYENSERNYDNFEKKYDNYEKSYDKFDKNYENSERNEENSQVFSEENSKKEGNIFLTVENGSMAEVEEKKKNYAFDIVMEKSDVIEDIEELKKKKIEEMEKKRIERIEEYRRNEEARDIKRSNSILRGTQKSVYSNNGSKISDDMDEQPPKSKSRRKTIGDKNSKEIQESAYHIKPPQPHRKSHLYEKSEISREELLQTPKTVAYDDRSKGKPPSTIFRDSPRRPDRSASKYTQEPKIEPKERKNTFVKQSNKKLMITALTNVCLPGELNRKEREKLSEIIEKQPSEFFVFLFKEYSRKVIKGIYILDGGQNILIKIYGDKAPQEIYSEQVQAFYRFDSGSREFKKLDGCKSFSLVVHAVDLA